MKTIVALFVALFAVNAHAERYLAMNYSDSVRIVLSDKKCEKAGFRGAAQRIDKEHMKMCWSLDEKTKMVHIQWQGGDFSEFPMSAFYPVEVN